MYKKGNRGIGGSKKGKRGRRKSDESRSKVKQRTKD